LTLVAERPLIGDGEMSGRVNDSSESTLAQGALAYSAMVRYEEPPWRPHDEVEAIFAGGDVDAICDALADPGSSHGVPASPTASQKTCAASLRTCLGHVARRFGAIRPESLALLRRLRDDPQVGGRAADALDDVRTFMMPAD
jgi:hypothetical protein